MSRLTKAERHALLPCFFLPLVVMLGSLALISIGSPIGREYWVYIVASSLLPMLFIIGRLMYIEEQVKKEIKPTLKVASNVVVD